MYVFECLKNLYQLKKHLKTSDDKGMKDFQDILKLLTLLCRKTALRLEYFLVLEILQTGKLDHNVALKCMWDHPACRAAIISLASMKARKLKFTGYLVGV